MFKKVTIKTSQQQQQLRNFTIRTQNVILMTNVLELLFIFSSFYQNKNYQENARRKNRHREKFDRDNDRE